MNTNIGAFDGAARIAIFLVLLVFAIFQGTLTAWLWVIPGVFLFASAVLNWCFVYELLGLNTVQKQ